MRRGPVLQGVEQEAELGAGFVGADAQRGEHLALHLGAVDAHRAAADLPAIEHHVVGLGDALLGGAVHQFFMAVLGRGEGVMHGGPALVVLVELEHGEVDDPQRLPTGFEQALALAEVAVADLDPQRADGVGHDLGFVGAEEQQVAVLRAAARKDGGNRRVVQVLDDGGLQSVAALGDVVDLDPRQAFGAVDLDEVGVSVDLAAGHGAAAGHAQGHHAAAGRGRRGGEHLEVHVAHHVGEFGELHLDAQVGFVGAEAGHGLGIGHHRVGIGEFDAEHVLEHAADHGLEQIADFLLVQEGGLAVDLGEFGLAVGAQVLVAEALGDLVVAVETRDHEHLLEQLGRLRQREELAVVHAAGHQVIACALGRALGEHGGLDVDETLGVEEAAHGHRNPVAQLEVVLHLRTAQIEHAMGQARGLGQVVVVELEGRRHRSVEHGDVVAQHFDLARSHVVVFGAGRTRPHQTLHLHAELVAQAFGHGEHGGAVGVAHHLHDAFAVTQVDENHPAMIAAAMHPAAQRHGLTQLGFGHLTAILTTQTHDGGVLSGNRPRGMDPQAQINSGS